MILSEQIIELISSIKIVVFDFDGVFTNNKVIVSEDGRESVICDRSDGLGIQILKKNGIYCFILSTEKNPVVSYRAKKLGLDCFQGCDDKLKELHRIVQKHGIQLNEVAFVGNDINDLECLKNVGLSIVVADAYTQAKNVAKIILLKNGGDGAVREVCELFMRRNIKSMT